jgi:drug/metabolite transporter (DMT)-like permease
VLRPLWATTWQFGSLLALVALGFHVVALARGGLILVQTILSSSLIVALGVEAVRGRRRMTPLEIAGSAVLVLGVVLLLAFGCPGEDLGRCAGSADRCSDPRRDRRDRRDRRNRHDRVPAAGRRPCSWVAMVAMGAAAAACFALDALYLRGFVDAVGGVDIAPAVADFVGFLSASMVGNLVVQRAYQRAPCPHRIKICRQSEI